MRVRFVPLTSEVGNEVDPALSASGRLAYVARGADGRPHIFTKTAADAAAVQVTRGEAQEMAPEWSPDETQLAFVRRSAERCGIWIMSADGRSQRELTPCTSTSEFGMSWSPDGRQLAVTAGGNTARSPSHIELVSIADGRRRVLTAPDSNYPGDWSPRFSPDGKTVAFIRSFAASVTDIARVPADGGDPSPVTFDHKDVIGFDWDADGRHIVFSSDRQGGYSIWRIDTVSPPFAGKHDPQPELLVGGAGKLKYPSVARRSRMVAYEEWQYEINLREQSTNADAASTSIAISPTSDRWNFHPAISPDGRQIAFESTRSGAYELWLSDRDGRNARPITKSGVYKSPARWSPDGSRLAFITRQDSSNASSDPASASMTLVVLNITDGVETVAMRTSGELVSPSWSHDGKSVYACGGERAYYILKADSDGARSPDRLEGRCYGAIESPDGRWLYLAHLTQPGLWRRPIDGGPETLVTEHVAADGWQNWGFYDRGIYYVTRPDDGDPYLAVIENGATVPRLLTRLPEFAWSGIALSGDGSRVIYAHADRRTSNIGGLLLR